MWAVLAMLATLLTLPRWPILAADFLELGILLNSFIGKCEILCGEVLVLDSLFDS